MFPFPSTWTLSTVHSYLSSLYCVSIYRSVSIKLCLAPMISSMLAMKVCKLCQYTLWSRFISIRASFIMMIVYGSTNRIFMFLAWLESDKRLSFGWSNWSLERAGFIRLLITYYTDWSSSLSSCQHERGTGYRLSLSTTLLLSKLITLTSLFFLAV